MIGWLLFAYLVVMAAIGQCTAISKLLAWIDRRYGQPWLERRLTR